VGWVVVDQLCFRLLICLPLPELFAIQVESCQKSRQNLDVFWPSQILGGWPSKNCTHVITPTLRHVAWKSFMRIFPLAPKLLKLSLLSEPQYSIFGATSIATKSIKRNNPARSLSIEIYSGIARFPCDSTAFLYVSGSSSAVHLVFHKLAYTSFGPLHNSHGYANPFKDTYTGRRIVHGKKIGASRQGLQIDARIRTAQIPRRTGPRGVDS